MKVDYFNISLFSLSLNILLLSTQVYNLRNHYTTHHTPKPNIRLLCECDIYTSIYNNDQEMQKVIQDFDRQTSQRFEEYKERKIQNRQKFKEQCDKEIQKIILKDKIEKELTEKLSTLQTDISTDDIPTCVCEKSLADKTENFCLNCGLGIGSGVLQASGLLGGIGAVAVNAWKPKALESAIEAALKAGAAKIAAAAETAGNTRGMEVVIKGLEAFKVDKLFSGISKSFFKATCYNDAASISRIIHGKYEAICKSLESGNETICRVISNNFDLIPKPGGSLVDPIDSIQGKLSQVFYKATLTAKGKAAEVTTTKTLAIKAAQEKAIEAASTHLYTTIAYSIIAVLIIVLIMAIIYLILRYRRKRKMKKKLQYIKLLK